GSSLPDLSALLGNLSTNPSTTVQVPPPKVEKKLDELLAPVTLDELISGTTTQEQPKTEEKRTSFEVIDKLLDHHEEKSSNLMSFQSEKEQKAAGILKLFNNVKPGTSIDRSSIKSTPSGNSSLSDILDDI